MKIIAHRGLLNGPDKIKENLIGEIKRNILIYPFIIHELDIWKIGNKMHIGHEITNKTVEINELISLKNNIIIHIKGLKNNFEYILSELINNNIHYFSHENDDFTITSNGWLWAHPKLKLIPGSICVMPEKIIALKNFNSLKEKKLKGVCTDFPLKMLEILD